MRLPALLLLLLPASVLRAQDTTAHPYQPAQPVTSMGQPSRMHPYVALSAGLHPGNAGTVSAGIERSMIDPVIGLLGLRAEGYASTGGPFAGGGVRGLFTIPLLAIGTGLDWNLGSSRAGRVDYVVSFQSALRRGGLLGHGSMLRVDWLPTRRQTVSVGVTMPIFQPWAGRTRPRVTTIRLPEASAPVGAQAAATLPAVDTLASLITAYTDVFTDGDVRTIVGSPSVYDSAMVLYDRALVAAFTAAARDSTLGDAATRAARAAMVDKVLVPFDSTYGEVKDDEDISDLTNAAQRQFARWVSDSSSIPAERAGDVLAVQRGWLRVIERVHHHLSAQQKDSRLVWLPFQLGLREDAYDDQEELDSLIARVVDRPFSDQNALTYLHSVDIPLEIARSIYAARDYHVLWTHDFTGQRMRGSVDNIAYEMVADVYLPALTAAVQRYDSTGHLPVYMILLDEYFYEPRNGRLWMSILENPLHASMRLPGHQDAREAHLRERQQALRDAVAKSARLQADARAADGDSWIRRVVKVHVNITNPADFSYRSRHVLPPFPFGTDNLMRDHRKMVFYDLSESDPFRGAMILMGIGIGEDYSSATWEDRGFRIRGPAALEARDAVRRVLRESGFREQDIPAPLRAVKGAPPDSVTERRMDIGDYVGRAIQVHNETGFGRKSASIARAMLYTLTPTGSVIIAPDPLWLDPIWGGMLAAAAARGSHVYVIAPAKNNAPSPQPPVMALERDLVVRMLHLRQQLAGPLQRSGGQLRVGLYIAEAPVNDTRARAREVQAGLARAPWIRDLFPFDSSTVAVLNKVAAGTATDAPDATALAHDERHRNPQLHQKTQLIARPGAIAALLRQPGWDDVLARSMRVQSQQTGKFEEQLGWTTPDVDSQAVRRSDALLKGYEQAIPEAERKRVSFYFSMGSQNQDLRSTVMDGEATVIVSGFHASAGMVDMYYLMTRSEWITTEAELATRLPQNPGWMRRLARMLRTAM